MTLVNVLIELGIVETARKAEAEEHLRRARLALNIAEKENISYGAARSRVDAAEDAKRADYSP